MGSDKDPTSRWELAGLLEQLIAETPGSRQRNHVEFVVTELKKPSDPPHLAYYVQYNVVAAEVAHALIDARHAIHMTPVGDVTWRVDLVANSPAAKAAEAGDKAGKAIFEKRMQHSYAERDARPQPPSLDDFLDKLLHANANKAQLPIEQCAVLMKAAEGHLLLLRKRLHDTEDLLDEWRAHAEKNDVRAIALQQELARRFGAGA
jgi:hypothetical protein